MASPSLSLHLAWVHEPLTTKATIHFLSSGTHLFSRQRCYILPELLTTKSENLHFHIFCNNVTKLPAGSSATEPHEGQLALPQQLSAHFDPKNNALRQLGAQVIPHSAFHG